MTASELNGEYAGCQKCRQKHAPIAVLYQKVNHCFHIFRKDKAANMNREQDEYRIGKPFACQGKVVGQMGAEFMTNNPKKELGNVPVARP